MTRLKTVGKASPSRCASLTCFFFALLFSSHSLSFSLFLFLSLRFFSSLFFLIISFCLSPSLPFVVCVSLFSSLSFSNSLSLLLSSFSTLARISVYVHTVPVSSLLFTLLLPPSFLIFASLFTFPLSFLPLCRTRLTYSLSLPNLPPHRMARNTLEHGKTAAFTAKASCALPTRCTRETSSLASFRAKVCVRGREEGGGRGKKGEKKGSKTKEEKA